MQAPPCRRVLHPACAGSSAIGSSCLKLKVTWSGRGVRSYHDINSKHLSIALLKAAWACAVRNSMAAAMPAST
eukprot:scaffold122304_cov23-Tisochrysis_lutea.AAC.3